ncbi:MAG: hypothetical protein ACO1TE_17105 [Prosthecobacter sp.]
MKRTLLVPILLLSLFSHLATATAGTIKLPEEKAAVSINVPDNWEPEEDEDGNVLAESPDGVTTIYFEIVATEKEMDTAIESSVEWLMEDHKVKVDEATKAEADFEVGGREFHRISWDGSHPEHGPAVVGFIFTEVGQGKVLTMTYWINKKDAEKSLEALGKIFESVKSIE